MINWERIAKYLTNEATTDERKQVEQWVQSDPANRKTLEELRSAIRPGIPDGLEFQNTMQPDWITLRERIAAQKHHKHDHTPIPYWYKIAASLLLLMLAGSGIWYVAGKLAKDHQSQIVSVESVKDVVLPDGSHVWLNKHSRLDVSEDFGHTERSVRLEGEAYFEVAPDRERPFIITTSTVTTKVLGTAFNVRLSDSLSTVTVTEGKVSVTGENNNTVLVLRDQVAVYKNDSKALTKEKNRELNFLTWKTGIIRFDAEPLKNVCLFLSEYYQTDIRLKDRSLERYAVTTVLDNVNVDEALSILSLTLDLKTEKKGSTVYFIE